MIFKCFETDEIAKLEIGSYWDGSQCYFPVVGRRHRFPEKSCLVFGCLYWLEKSPGFSLEFVHRETKSRLWRQSQCLQLYLECNWNVHWRFLLLTDLVNPFMQFRLEDKAAVFNRAGKDMNCQVSYVQDTFANAYKIDTKLYFSSHCFSLDHQKQS